MTSSTSSTAAAEGLVWLGLVAPAVAAALALVVPRPRLVHGLEIAAAVAVLGVGVSLVGVLSSGHDAVVTGGGVLRVDALAAFLLTVIGAVAVTATWGGRSRARAGSPRGARYAALVCLFVTAMVLAVVADDLGVTWVAVEATTITTAFLVGHAGGARAVEAAWKYVVLASVGIAIAFFGLVLVYAAARAAGTATLSWSTLMTVRPPVDPALARLGLALAALGFATKAGLAPMHSWLPDAHGQAPAPVSGLMSGVLLAVSFGAILRLQRLDDALLDGDTVRRMLLVGGLLSVAVAAALVLTQRDVKRLLAYSSVEHMGIVAVAAAIGGRLALTAMLLHLLGHGLAKSATFLAAGGILASERTTRIDDVHALLRRRPRLGAMLLVGGGALLGLPPSVLFFTEAAIVVAGFERGYGWAMALLLALLLVVFVGFGRQLLRMALSEEGPVPGPGPVAEVATVEVATAGTVAVPVAPGILALATTAVLAVAVWPLGTVLQQAVAILVGTP